MSVTASANGRDCENSSTVVITNGQNKIHLINSGLKLEVKFKYCNLSTSICLKLNIQILIIQSNSRQHEGGCAAAHLNMDVQLGEIPGDPDISDNTSVPMRIAKEIDLVNTNRTQSNATTSPDLKNASGLKRKTSSPVDDTPHRDSKTRNTESPKIIFPLNKETMLYNKKHTGPFSVYIQPADGNDTPRLNATIIGRILTPHYPQDIQEIKSSGQRRITIIFKKYEAANRLIKDPLLKSKKLEAFIPSHCVMKAGIIKGVPTDITEDEIIKHSANLENQYNIIAARRFYKNNVNDEGILGKTPTTTIQITFDGLLLPQHIYLFNVRHPVELYLPQVRICRKCYRYGHVKEACKSKPRCSHCGQEGHSSIINCPLEKSEPKCLHCQGQHDSSDKNCPERSKQQQIKNLAIKMNISINESRNILYPTNKTNTKFNFADFPSLTNSFWTDQDHQEHTSNSYKKPSFAKMTEGIKSNQMAKKATAPYKTSSYEFFPKPYSEQHAAMLISPNGRNSTGENGTALMTPIPSTLETVSPNNDYLCQIIVLLNQITQFIQPLLKDPNILKLINPPNIPTNIQNAENSSTRITQDSTNK